MSESRVRVVLSGIIFMLLMSAGTVRSQSPITSPKEEFGHDIGEDYFLANYTQYEAYIKKLAQESNRMTVAPMGKSEEGRAMYLVTITSPENHKNLARYKDISKRLALAEGLTDEQAKQLAAEGKSVVWIDGGLHATEVLGAQQLIQCIYDLVTKNDAETLRILNDDIVLAVLINPDGMELVSNWYMRESDPLKRSMAGVPVLYNKYAGHDDNRDSFMVNLSETDAINHVMFREWYPQIMYNHHQTGPAGTVMFSPPFRDPMNFFYDPLMISELDEVASAIHSRMIAENKPGVTMRSGSTYSTWYNGGLRTTAHFHNMVGILTESIGDPTPIEIPLVFRNQLPRQDLPDPIAPQVWHFKRSIEYSMTANYAVLDIASRKKDEFLYNMYVMGRNGIERGKRDNWSISPHRLDEIEKAANAEMAGGRGGGQRGGGQALTGQMAQKYFAMIHDRASRDPRGYIIPSDQTDFLTAIKFANILIKNGVTVESARTAFTVAGKSYPAGTLVVFTGQAFRPHVLDMFEPQDHPDDFAYPGAPPTPPYDIAGWTPAYTMGVKFDRILDGFDCPCDRHTEEFKPPAGKVTTTSNTVGYLLNHQQNDSFVAVNRLLATNEEVYWVKNSFGANGKTWAAGTDFIPAKPTTLAKLQKLAAEVGLNFEAVSAKPPGDALMLRKLRVGLVDKYGGSMPSGWIRQQLERFEFSFEQVFPPTLDAGNLASKYDVLLFADDTLQGGGTAPPDIPADYQSRVGAFTDAKTLPQIKRFLEEGGTVLAIGRSTRLGFALQLPIDNALVEKAADGSVRPLTSTKFYVPGSVLQAAVDNTDPLAFGMPEHADFLFDNSPSFALKPDALKKGVRPVSWFDSDKSLRSGWAWGQGYLQNSVAALEAQVGKGKLFLFGPEIMFRGQPHGTFKLMFNGIYYGRAETVNLGQ